MNLELITKAEALRVLQDENIHQMDIDEIVKILKTSLNALSLIGLFSFTFFVSLSGCVITLLINLI